MINFEQNVLHLTEYYRIVRHLTEYYRIVGHYLYSGRGFINTMNITFLKFSFLTSFFQMTSLQVN